MTVVVQPIKKKIFLVEDEKDIRRLYSDFLKEAGYEVVEFSDGLSVMEEALKTDWDLILLDIMLPGQDGLQILKSLKANALTNLKPVIILTNLSIESVAQEVFSLGADGFLIKSEITPDKIVSEIEGAFQKYN